MPRFQCFALLRELKLPFAAAQKTGPTQQRRDYSGPDMYSVPYEMPMVGLAPGPMRMMAMRPPPVFGMFGMGPQIASGHRVTRHVLEYDDL